VGARWELSWHPAKPNLEKHVRHVAQFIGIMCVELCASRPSLILNGSPKLVSYPFSILFHHSLYYMSFFMNESNFVTSHVISSGYKKKTHISCRDDCAFIFVLSVDANSFFRQKINFLHLSVDVIQKK
jgi:hypothetical protein